MKFSLDKIKAAASAAVAGAIEQVFAGAALMEQVPIVHEPPTPAVDRTIAVSALTEQIWQALRALNAGARKVDERGDVYIDWDVYLNYMDTFYDNGDLFVICTRAGKLWNLPVTVTDDVATLGEPVEVPLTRANKGRVWVHRDSSGKRRWLSIAGSAVINRSNELDSTRLFDSFIEHAERTGEYPILSFYHLPEIFRFGIADHLYRDEYLYIATGTFYEDKASQAVADGLERASESEADAHEWGNSIGFNSIGDPELLDVGNGVTIPMYVRGVNAEISIVLESDAAALFTRMSAAEEVKRSMNTKVKKNLSALVPADILAELEAVADTANRTIEDEDLVARTTVETAAVPAVTTETPAAVVAVAVAPVVTVPAVAPTTETRAETPQELELDDALFDGLVAAIQASPAQVALTQSLTQISGQLQELGTRLGTVEAAQTENRARVAALEVDEDTRTAAVIADMPRRQTVITYRPRTRAQTDAETIEETAPTSEEIAQATLSKIPTALRGHQPAAQA